MREPLTEAPREPKTAHLDAWLVFAAFSLLRALLAPSFGLMPQDAYYFFYAEHPSLSYLDHPPMIGVLLGAFAAAFGKSELTVRLATFTTTLAMQLAFYALGRRFLPAARRHRGFFLLAISNGATVLSLIATPDVPLMLFWALALLALAKAVFDGHRPSWLAAGLLMGLAFDSKYTGALLQVGLLLYLGLESRHRHLLRAPWPWLALALAQVVSLPVWIWNARHGGASFVYQTAFRAETVLSLSPTNLLGLTATQMYLLTPPVFLLLVALLWRHLKRLRRGARPSARSAFLLAFFAPGFVGFFALTLIFWVKINWILPAYLTGLLLAARWAHRRLLRRALAWSLVLHALLAVELVFYPVPIRGDDTWFGWRELARQVEVRSESHPQAFVFSEDGYKTTAQLSFHLERRIYGPEVIDDLRFHFRFVWPELEGAALEDLVGRDALWIDSARTLRPGWASRPAPSYVTAYFDSVEPLEPILVEHRGRVVRRFRVYLCQGYLGPTGRPQGRLQAREEADETSP